MAQAFNLTAQINLQAPSNLKSVVSQIRREFGTLSADVKLNISPQSAKSVDNVRSRIDAMNASLIQARNNTTALDSALRNLSSSLSSVQSNATKTDASFTKTAASVGQTAKNIKVASTEMEEFGKQSALAIRRFAAFSVVTSGVFALINAVSSGFKAFVEFDKELVKLQQVTGKGAIGLRSLEKEITSLSTSLGVSSKSLIAVASTLAQAGLSAEETRVALSALAKTELAPSFDNLTDTTEGAIAAIRQFGLEAKDLEKALGSINAVAAAFAVESKDIISAIQRTGGVFAASSRGVSEGTDALNEFIAVFTSIRQTTRESAETIATGLRTIFTRIQRAKTIDQLKEYGVTLTDLEGKFVGPFEAVKRLSAALSQLDPRDLRFSSIVEELGGFRQIGKVIPLIQQFAVAQNALAVAQKGQGSLYDAQITAQKSLANQLAKVREQFLALVRDIGQSQSFQGLFKIVTGLASGLISLASAFKPILPILAIMGAVKGVSAIRQFGSGFVGGLSRGGGARGVGSNVGESLSGAKEKERADATQRASAAITENTTAIKSLTTAVSQLITSTNNLQSSINNRGGGATLNAGGIVRKFARGGVVPGSGNGDTVPAMLEPGEFVIRKKAVETIGSNNLHRINKYANGGGVQRLAGGGKTVEVKRDVPEESLLDTSIVESTWSKLISQVGKRFSPNRKVRKRSFTNLDPRQQGAVKGYVFEEALRAAGQGAETSGRDFDYRSWKSNQYFNQLKTGDIVDAKLSTDAASVAEFAKKIANLQKNEPSIDIRKAKFGAAIFDPLAKDLEPLKIPLSTIRKYRQKKYLGGLIQKFSGGGEPDTIEAIAQRKGISLADALLEELTRFGGIAGVRSTLGIGGGDRSISSILRADNIKAGKNTSAAASLVNRVLAKTSEDEATYQEFLRRAAKNQLAVVGITGDRGANEPIMTPGAIDNSTGARAQAIPATINAGALPPAVAKRVQALIRNNIERLVNNVGNQIAKASGSTFNANKSILRQISAKDIEDLSGPIFEKAVGLVSGNYDPSSKALDFSKGLSKPLASLLGVPARVPTDATNNATLQNARDKVGGGQFDRGRIQARKNLGGFIQKLAGGGIANAPLIDDILQASGSVLPRPGSAIEALVAAGGGAIDIDRTLKRTLGDKAYSSAPGSAKDAVLSRYFRDDNQRLDDIKSAPLTSFGKELIQAIRSKKLNPKTLSIISKSRRTSGVPEYLNNLFGIPMENMVFTQGGDKQPALDALRTKGPRVDRVRYALGGSVEDTVPALLTPGEFVINKKAAQRIGYGKLNRLNQADKLQGYNKGGIVEGIQKFFRGGVAEKDTERAQGSLISDIKEAEKIFATIMDQLGANIKASVLDKFKGIESVSSGEQTSFGGNAFKEATRGKAERNAKGQTLIGLQIGGQRAAATTETVAHETGHLADMALGGNKGLASQTEGTFQFELVKKVKPVMEKAFKKAGYSAEKIAEYLASNEELFAEFFAKSSPQVRSIITSTTDAETGMKALADHLGDTGYTYAGLEASDIDQTKPKAQRSLGSKLFGGVTNTLGSVGSKVSSFFRPNTQPTNKTQIPNTPLPSDLMPFSTAVKVATEATKQAEEEISYLTSRAKEGGQTLEGLGKTLATKVVTQANKLSQDQPGKKQDLRNFAIEKRANLSALKQSGDQTSFENARNEAVQEFINKLKEIDFTAAEDKINSAAQAFVDGLSNNDSLSKIFADDNKNVGNEALKDIFNKTYNETEILNESFKKLAESSGFTEQQLQKLTEAELKRQQFIQSEVGQKYGKLSEVAPGMVSKFANTKLGQRLSSASDINANLFGKSLGLFGKTMGKIGTTLDKKFQSVGGSLVAFGGQVAIVSDKLPEMINAFGLNNSVAAAGVVGGVQGAGQGLASGALLGGQIAGPVGALVLGIGGAIIKGINSTFDAINEKKLQNTLRTLDKTSADLDAAFKKLESSATRTNVESAEARLKEDVKAGDLLRAQANFGNDDSLVKIARAFDFTGITGSLTGQKIEGEAGRSLVTQLGRQLEAAEKIGAVQLSQVSTQNIDNFFKDLPILPEKRADQTQEQYEEENKAAINERNIRLARANQTYQQLAKTGMSENEILQTKYIDYATKQGKTPEQIKEDLSTEKGKERARDIAIKQLAVDSELGIKQQFLTRASRELAKATDNLIDIYRRAQGGLLRYSQELDRFESDAIMRANTMTGGAKIRNVDRSNENALGNITAYSMDEVKRIAAQTAAMSGGGDTGETLKNNIITAKILQDELPKALKGAKEGDVDSVIANLEEAFKTAKTTMSEQVKTELRAKLQEKMTNRQGNLGLSDLAEDMSFIQDSLKLTEEALKTGQMVQKAYNDTLQSSINLLDEYNSNLDKNDEWQRKATDIRLNGEIDLARALGKAPTLKQLNKPFESRVRSLSSGLIVGGSTDPNQINAVRQQKIEESKAIQKRIDENKNRLGMPGQDTKTINENIEKDQRALAQHTRAINNGNKALEELANNSEAASNALNAIQEREQLRDNAVGAIERILTSDPMQLADQTRQLEAYTKTISGNISPRDAGDLQFRQDAFAGLNSLQGLMPDDMFKQMKAKAALEMIQAGPNSQEILNSTAGYSRDENGNLIKMTVEQALKARAEGKPELDPAQKALIDTYNAAIAAQQQAAQALADNALAAAEQLNMDIKQLFAGIEEKLAKILAEAKANAQPPEPEVKPKTIPDKPFETSKSKSEDKPSEDRSNDRAGAIVGSIINGLVAALGAGLAIKGLSKIKPINRMLPTWLGGPKPGTGSWKGLDLGGGAKAAVDAADDVAPPKMPKTRGGKTGAVLTIASILAAMAAYSLSGKGDDASSKTEAPSDQTPTQDKNKTTETTQPTPEKSTSEQSLTDTKKPKETRSMVLDGLQSLLGLGGLVPGFGEPLDLINSAIYSARAASSSDPGVQKDLAVDAGLSGLSAVPIGGWAASAVQQGRNGVRAGKAVANAVGMGVEFATSNAAAQAAMPLRPDVQANPETSSGVPELPMQGLPQTENYDKNYEQWKETQTDAAMMGDTTKIESTELNTIADMAKQAMTPGSIYTHDIHSEEILNKILTALNEIKKVLETTDIAIPQLTQPQTTAQANVTANSGALAAPIAQTQANAASIALPQVYGSTDQSANTPLVSSQRTPEQEKAIRDKEKADKEFAEKYSKENPEYAATADQIAGGKSSLEARAARGEKLSENQQFELDQQRRDEYFRRRNNGEKDLDYDQMVYARQERALEYENKDKPKTTRDGVSTGSILSNIGAPVAPVAQTQTNAASVTSPQVYGSTKPVSGFSQKQSIKLRQLMAKGKLRVGEDGLPVGRNSEEQKEYEDLRKQKMDADPQLAAKVRERELKNKGKLRVSEDGLPIGRSPQEEQEYREMVANKPLTPYQQAQKQKREAYLARFRPEVRERMMTKEEKAAQRFASTINVSSQQIGANTQQELASSRPDFFAGSDQVIHDAHAGTNRDKYDPNSLRLPSGPIPTPLPTQTVASQQATRPTEPSSGGVNATGYSITLDETSRQFMTSFSESINGFGSYVKDLASIKIPDQVTISGNYTVDLKISGSAAIEALDKKIKEIGETLVSSTDFTTALNQLRDEVSVATKNAVKSSSSRGSTTAQS